MVVRTNSLKSLKNFLPQLHQPLPLNKRESRQLLESITASFRKNLDEEHPWGSSKDESVSRNTTRLKQDSPLLKSTSTSSNRPTEKHLHAILSHPLFTHQERPKPAAALDPFHVFDTAVSRGLMTPRRAAGFLSKVRTQIKAENPDTEQEAMAKSGAGLRVVQWMRTSGLESNMQSFSNVPLFWNLIPFMYAEGFEELVWTWVARLGSQNEPGNCEGITATALYRLLQAINRLKGEGVMSSGTHSLDDAYKAMLYAYDILQPEKNRIAFGSYRMAWVSLALSSTLLVSRYPKPSAPIFDAFVDVGRSLEAPMHIAHLELHHPLKPNHSAAVQFMHQKADHAAQIGNSPFYRKQFVCLALDTADRLKEVGDVEEVSWIERLLTKLGNDLNSSISNILNTQTDSSAESRLRTWLTV
ncbi:uncharacterized protein GGS22DRAFT_153667 [Annulohypoxylon maeteangense]|uniref:uncharacterized protein n=1 Tax=Annulohypoxylon maeteangense TaxID=1927788 RepID=UPI002007E144|nr:uncharacterized protein GGS22DRAFT_153667 [Annulohypoxylon maeteangense]KAI0889338.1 hypothetical protein GGS22DRAFT_153667 [Annulohypoxylon maeteangense]